MGICGSADVINIEEVDLSHFVVGSCIGKGGFGKVHAVIHKGSGVQMAMKRLTKNKIIQQQWYIDSLWVERNLLELLDSPFTSTLYFAFQTPHELFLVMPYLRGGDLAYFLSQKTKMKPELLFYYSSEVILALKELRRLNVVYRDMKPENLIFNETGHLILTDFGICTKLDKSNGFKIQEKIGTLQYMSPQQFLQKEYTFATDYFSFGLTLYEMATGKRLLSAIRTEENETNEYYSGFLNAIVDSKLKDLLTLLLKIEESDRIGTEKIEDIMEHAYFKDNTSQIKWEDFENLSGSNLTTPYKPRLSQVNCFADTIAMEAFEDDPTDMKPPKEEEQKLFNDFEFNTEIDDEVQEKWKAIQEKNKSRTNRAVSVLWNSPIATNQFTPPISKFTNKDFTRRTIVMNKPLPAQFKNQPNTEECIDPELEKVENNEA